MQNFRPAIEISLSAVTNQLDQVCFQPLIESIQPELNKLFIAKLKHSHDFEIASYINVNCSYAELLMLFHTNNNQQHAANMKELYGSMFVNGDIIQSALPKQVSVKQACFKDSFFQTRHWVYTENYRYTDDGFITIITTIDGIMPHSINGITAAYTIKILQLDSNLQRNINFNIMFRGKIAQGCGKAKKYLLMLAKSIRKIPEIITSRQILIQSRTPTEYARYNNHCISCVKPIFCHRLPYFKSKCNLCAYYVCQSCSHNKMLFNQSQFESITICTRCLTRLKYCNYSSVSEQSLLFRNIILDKKDYDAGSNIFNYLIEHRDSNQSIDRLIKIMLKLNAIDNDTLLDYLTQHPAQEDCDISTASHPRTYPLDIPSSLLELDRIILPTPSNESERLKAVYRVCPERLIYNTDLNQLCQIANDELDSMATIISIIEDIKICAIASTNPSYIQYYDRNEGICQYLVMDGKPLLIINPEVDMRFCNLPVVKTMNIKFYFSVPIFSSDNYIIGSFCTIDSSVKRITISQYSIMRKLAQLVSAIIEELACTWLSNG